MTVLSAPCSPSNLSSVTLVGSTGSDSGDSNQQHQNNQQENAPPSSSEQPHTTPTTQILQSALGKHAEAAKDVLKSPLKIAQDRR